FFLKGHHEFDGIETIRTEVVDETCGIRHLLRLDAEVLNHNLLHSLANVTHRPNLVLVNKTPPHSDASHRALADRNPVAKLAFELASPCGPTVLDSNGPRSRNIRT